VCGCLPPISDGIISLFSPLPGAATTDRQTNSNLLDGWCRELKKELKTDGVSG